MVSCSFVPRSACSDISPKTESTEVFFSVTKLFHATDGNLRRLLYLIIKEIHPSADEVNTQLFPMQLLFIR